MEQMKKNDLLLKVVRLNLKRLRNEILSPEQEAELDEALKNLEMSLKEAIEAASKLLANR